MQTDGPSIIHVSGYETWLQPFYDATVYEISNKAYKGVIYNEVMLILIMGC